MLSRKKLFACFAIIGIVAFGFVAAIPGFLVNQAATPAASPAFDYVVTIMLENRGYCDVITTCGGGGAYQTSLVTTYATAGPNGYSANDHPSEGNYVILIAGNDYGMTSDCGYCPGRSNAQNIVDLIEAGGKTWQAWYEDGSGSGTCSAHPPRGGDHYAFISFSTIVNNPARCSHLLSTTGGTDTQFLAALNSATPANYIWLTPNEFDNCHDSSVPECDAYVATLVPKILSSTLFTTKNAVLFITYDEGNGSYPSDWIYTAWVGSAVKQAYTGTGHYNHCSYLATIEVVWGLSNLGQCDVGATPMTEFFGTSTPPTFSTSFTVSGSTVNSPTAFATTTVGGTAPYTINWNFGDGSSGSGATATHTYTATGTYTVTETAKDSSSPQKTTTSSQSLTITSQLSGNFGVCTSLPQGWSCDNTNGLSGSGLSITNGVLFTKQRNPGVGNDNSYYYATTQKGTFPWSPCQAPASGAIPPGVTSVSSTFTPTLLPTMSSGMRYHIYIALYYWLPNGAVSSGSKTYRCLDTQVRVVNVGGTFQPVGHTETYDPGDSFGWATVPIGSVTTGGTYTLTADVQQLCQSDFAAWGLPTSTPCQLAGIEIGTEGFQFQEIDVTWMSVDLATSQQPPLTAGINSSPSSPLTGQTVSFTSSVTGGTSPYTYSWNFGDSATSTGQNPTHSYSSSGTYTVTLTVRDSSNPQKSASTSQTLTVTTPPPTLSAYFTFSPSSPQVGQSVSFTATATGGSQPYSYSWNFGDGATGSSRSMTHSYSTAQNYMVTLTVRDNAGVSVSTSQTVTVAPAPPAPLQASITVSSANVQVGQTVTFTGSATGGVQPYGYSWDYGDGTTASGAVVGHSYTAPGAYTAMLTVTDSSSGTSSASAAVTVSPLPSPDFSISSSPASLTVQAGNSITSQVQLTSLNGFSGSVSLSATVSPSGPSAGMTVTTITLTSGGASFSTLTVLTTSSTSTGTYDVAVTAAGGLTSHVFHVALTVTSVPPPPDFALSVSQSTLTIQAGRMKNSVATLSATGGFSGVVMLSGTSDSGLNFTFSQGSVTLSGNSQTVTIVVGVLPSTFAGSYSVTITAISGSVQHSVTITVKATHNNRPTVKVPGPKNVAAGSLIEFVVNATDPDTGQILTLSVDGLPQGASFDPATGMFSWIPLAGQVGTYNVTFNVIDDGVPPMVDSNFVIITVGQAQPPPQGQGQGSCVICEITQVASTNTWLLIAGGLFGFLMTMTVVYLRARSRLAQARRMRRLTRYR